MKSERKKQYVATKCWSCKNAVCGCSWSRKFEPVAGWIAVPTRTYNGQTKGIPRLVESFLVLDCPEYEVD